MFLSRVLGRTPQGVRGLKYLNLKLFLLILESHPARGAWIEMEIVENQSAIDYGRTPQGVRGLKSKVGATHFNTSFLGRTPQGVRGLKCRKVAKSLGRKSSHPARGAWIEICLSA